MMSLPLPMVVELGDGADGVGAGRGLRGDVRKAIRGLRDVSVMRPCRLLFIALLPLRTS